jgi:putative flippase GtrA
MNRIIEFVKASKDEFLRYLIVGGGAFVVDYGTLLLLTKIAGVNYLISATIAFLLGTFVNYLGSISFVFTQRAMMNIHLERLLFITIGALGLVINDGMMYLLTGVMLIDVTFSKLITQAVVLLWNYLARKKLLFTPKAGMEQ